MNTIKVTLKQIAARCGVSTNTVSLALRGMSGISEKTRKRIESAAYEMGYFPIQWNVDSLDWKDYGVDSIIKTVCKHEALGPGSIILCHNGAKYTADALDELLTNLEEQGYEFVKISDLIMKDHYHMDVTGKQIAD